MKKMKNKEIKVLKKNVLTPIYVKEEEFKRLEKEAQPTEELKRLLSCISFKGN